MNENRYKYLSKKSKHELAQMHVANGGLMGLATYMKWTKDELISILLEDEEADARNPYTAEGAGFGGQDITYEIDGGADR